MQRPLRIAGHGGGRPGDQGVAQPGASGVAGGFLRQGYSRTPRANLSSGPGALSHETHRAARRGAVAAGVVGRGAGRDGGGDAGGARSVRPDGALRCGEQRALQPRGGAGAVAARLRLPQLDDEPGPVRRVPGVERPDHGAGHRQGRGYRQHPLRAHRRAQSVCGGPAAVAGAQARQGKGRERHRHRPGRNTGVLHGGPVAAAPARNGCRHRAGDDPLAGGAPALRPGLRRALVPRLRRVGRAGGSVPGGAGGGAHRGAAGGHRAGRGALCRRPVLFRERARHRRLQRGGSDVPGVPLPGGHQRQPGPRGRQPAREAAGGVHQLHRGAAQARIPSAPGGGEADHRRGPVSRCGRGPRAGRRRATIRR